MRTNRLEFIGDIPDSAPLDNFTGEVLLFWTTGEIKAKMQYSNGTQIGQHACFWRNGVIAQLGYFSPSGEARGVWLEFDEDGDKTKETHYYSTGNVSNRYFDYAGNLSRLEVLRNWELVYSRIFGAS